jgi:hypothetical protein
VHVRALIEELNLCAIPSLVTVVAEVTGLVQVLDAVDQEPQSETAILD